jgi:hypothetical protein
MIDRALMFITGRIDKNSGSIVGIVTAHGLED